MKALTSEQERELIAEARAAHPREACGIVSGGRIIRLPNRASGTGQFRIAAEDMEAAAAEHGLRSLDGVWHSHPSGDPRPSALDLASHPWPAALIVVAGETVNVYREVTDA